ncbi:MAG: limonene-1,2-epoxide hydrolase family protein [Burkholderiales bacterium]
MTALQPQRRRTMSNADTITRFIAAWERLDIDGILSFFAEGATYHNVPMAPLVGHGPIRGFVAQFLGGAVSAAFEVRNSAETAQGVVLNERIDRFVMKDGRQLAIPVMGVFELADGKITAWRDYFDMKAISPA